MVEKSELAANAPDWWSQFFTPVRQFGEKVADFFSPNSEAAATEDCYEISVELPGVSEDEIVVEVHDGRLVVLGEKTVTREEHGKRYYFSERAYGKFQRSFRLPEDADIDRTTANHENGLLTVLVPKKTPSAGKPRAIKVKKS